MYSDNAVMVRLGLTPKFAGTTEPSTMKRFGYPNTSDDEIEI